LEEAKSAGKTPQNPSLEDPLQEPQPGVKFEICRSDCQQIRQISLWQRRRWQPMLTTGLRNSVSEGEGGILRSPPIAFPDLWIFGYWDLWIFELSNLWLSGYL